MESLVSLGRKEGHTDAQISAKLKIEPGDLVVGRQGSYQLHQPNLPKKKRRERKKAFMEPTKLI